MHLRARRSIALVALPVLIALHAAVLSLVSVHVSVVLFAGVVGLVVLKYAWWTLRR